MGLYEDLQERKSYGRRLSLNALSREDLRKIWFDESHSDKTIAELFDVKPSVVRDKRREMGLDWYELKWEAITKHLEDEFNERSDEAKRIIEEELRKRLKDKEDK